MEVKKLDAVPFAGVPIPEDGKRPEDEIPLKIGFDNLGVKVNLARLPDPTNIEIGSGTGLAAIGATNIVPLTNLQENPISWVWTGSSKYKFNLCATLTGNINKTLAQVLQDHNVVIFNDDVAAIAYGGLLVLTIGTVGSGADIILTEDHVRAGNFLVTVVRTSEEF